MKPTNIDRDLNKLSVHELNEVKREMDVDFNKKRILPGDPGFEYDVRKDFDDISKHTDSWDEGVVS